MSKRNPFAGHGWRVGGSGELWSLQKTEEEGGERAFCVHAMGFPVLGTVLTQAGNISRVDLGGVWLAHCVGHVTLGLGVLSSSPTLGVEIT